MDSSELWHRFEAEPPADDAEHWVSVYSELERTLESLLAGLGHQAPTSAPHLERQLRAIRGRLAFWRGVRSSSSVVAPF